MGCRILADDQPDRTCWYCSTTGLAFGPTFHSVHEAREFDAYYFSELHGIHGDPRLMDADDLAALLANWRARREEASMTTHLSPDRIGRITSSTAAPCLRKHKTRSEMWAWQTIRGEKVDEIDPALAERGTGLEPAIMEWGARHLDATSWYKPEFLIHPEHDWLGTSADALYLVGDSLIVGEGKSVAAGQVKRWGEPGTDQIPEETLIQCHIHLICYPDAARCFVPILTAGFDFSFKGYWVNRDAELRAILIDRLGTWHQRHIVDGVRPEATALDNDILRDLFPTSSKGALADAEKLVEVAKWARDYDTSHKELKALEASKKLASAKLRELLTEHGEAKGEGFSVTYRNTRERTRTDWEAIAKAMDPPEGLVQQHTRVSPGARSLRVSIPKEKSK